MNVGKGAWRLLNDAAHMRVGAHVDRARLRATDTGWMNGFYAGKVSASRFLLRHFHEDHPGKRKLVAGLMREWRNYYRCRDRAA